MISFTVYGRPRPQGSKRPVRLKNGRTVLLEMSKELKPWRQEIAAAALFARKQDAIAFPTGPVTVALDFYFAKPKSAKKRNRPTTRPDVDKTSRSCLDAVTGILIKDDSQVVELIARKFYGDPERVEITLEVLR